MYFVFFLKIFRLQTIDQLLVRKIQISMLVCHLMQYADTNIGGGTL